MHCCARASVLLIALVLGRTDAACGQVPGGKADSVLPHLRDALGLPWGDVRLGEPMDTARARRLKLRPLMASFQHQVWGTWPRSDKLEVVVTVASDVVRFETPDATVAAVSVDLSTKNEDEFVHAYSRLRESLRSLPTPDACERDSVISSRGTALHVMFSARWDDGGTGVGLSASVPRRGPSGTGVRNEDEYHLHFRIWQQGDPQVGMTVVTRRVTPCVFDDAVLATLRRRISADSLRLLTPRLGPPAPRE